MKNFILLGLFTILLFGCEDDDVSSGALPPVHQLTEIMEVFPLDRYRDSEEVVYVNEGGEERVFQIRFVESETQMTNQDPPAERKTQTYKVDLLNESVVYRPTIYVRANDWAGGTAEKLFAAILNGVGEVWVPAIDLARGDGYEGGTYDNERIPEMTLLDRTFTDVYLSHPMPEATHFSTLYYHAEEGIIGYHTMNNELWVLKEYR